MIDPLGRWRRYGEKPDFAGLLTYGGAPYTEDAAELAGADVAIIGAPMDDTVSDHPGARFGPRAIRNASCPPGPHLAAGVDAFAALRVVDFGDAAVVPADPPASHAAIEAVVGEALGAGALPFVLGGDHSTTEATVRALARHHGGPVGLLHFDAHTDTGAHVFGAELSHGTPMFRLVEQGHVDPARYVQIGLRGYWPGEEVFAWQRERGIRDIRMHEVAERGVEAVVADAVAHLAGGGPVHLSFDIDTVDPAFAPGTGTPEPGGLTSHEALLAMRLAASGLDLCGADVVEVQDDRVTAVLADRLVREALTGMALRRADG
jgi:agmatinase